MKIGSVRSFPTRVFTFGSREAIFEDHVKVHSHFEDDPWFEDEGHNLSLKWGGAPYYNILCKGRDLAPGGVNGNSVGNTFFSLTKVKVNIDIKFNIYLKFDINLNVNVNFCEWKESIAEIAITKTTLKNCQLQMLILLLHVKTAFNLHSILIVLLKAWSVILSLRYWWRCNGAVYCTSTLYINIQEKKLHYNLLALVLALYHIG